MRLTPIALIPTTTAPIITSRRAPPASHRDARVPDDRAEDRRMPQRGAGGVPRDGSTTPVTAKGAMSPALRPRPAPRTDGWRTRALRPRSGREVAVVDELRRPGIRPSGPGGNGSRGHAGTPDGVA